MASTEGSAGKAVVAALHEVNAALLTEAVPNVIPLQVVARHARDLTDADMAAIAVRGDDPGSLVVRVADGVDADKLIDVAVPVDASLVGEVFTTGRALILADAASDPRALPVAKDLASIGPTILAPLLTARAPIGTLAVGRVRAREPFTLGDRDVVAAFATQAAVVLHLANSQQALLALADADRRERLARELHDTVIQRLYGISLSFQSLLAITPPAAASRIDELITELDATINEIRSTIFE